jgi:hypothetical protein
MESFVFVVKSIEMKTGPSLPDFIKNKFAVFLECGVLAHDFLCLRCVDCIQQRIAQMAVHLVDCVIPNSAALPVRCPSASAVVGIASHSNAISTFLIR